LHSAVQDDDFDVPHVGVPSNFYFTTWISTPFFKLNAIPTYGTSKRRSWPHDFKGNKDITFQPQKRGIITIKPFTGRYPPQYLRNYNFLSDGCVQQFKTMILMCHMLGFQATFILPHGYPHLFSNLTQSQHMAHQNEGLGLTISKVTRILHFSHKKVALSPKNPLQVDIQHKYLRIYNFYLTVAISSSRR
jgi:hypothetical protein